MTTTRQSLGGFIADLPIVSTHEHHREGAWQRDLDLDRLLLNSYVRGISPFRDGIADRDAFLEHVRANSFFVWLERAVQRIYGVERLTAESWDGISARIRAAHAADPDWHLTVMRRFGGYRRAVQDTYWRPGSDAGHPEFLSPALRINAFVLCHHPEMADHNGNSPWRLLDLAGRSFDEYLDLLDATLAARKAAGLAALKSAIAYDRDLAFEPGTRDGAARVFGRHPSEVSDAEHRAYQGFLFDHFCALAAKHDLPFQHHTGLGILAGSRPMNLLPMITRHPGTRFVLLHGGYPWVHEVAGLSLSHRNVFPDLTWLPLISPTAAIRAVREWLETTPGAHAICWGGDAWTGEESVSARRSP
ncbi:MAG: amidohydrolase family protein [Armatimonadetes bacterium]|nr:amidohydrolase family protein [Armatimonadota bacterium]